MCGGASRNEIRDERAARLPAAGAVQEERAFTPESENQLVFMGLPQSRFRDQLPELDWVVVMQGPYDEIFAPFENINRGFLYIVVFSAAAVLVLTVVFSWMMAKPALEIDPRLDGL